MAKVIKLDKARELEVMTPEYIEELESKIKSDMDELSRIDNNIEKYTQYINKFSLFNIPYKYGEYDLCSLGIISNKFNGSWEDHKKYLYNYWRGRSKSNKVIAEPTEAFLYIMAHIVYFAIAIWNISSKFMWAIKVNRVLAFVVLYIFMELICGAASTYYYLFRPNIINNRQFKKEVKALKAERKLIQVSVDNARGLLEAYKLSQLSPSNTFTAVRGRTVEQLGSILQQAYIGLEHCDVDEIKHKYKITLDKCYQLLDMARENGTIVTEISKIYNIYITEINTIISKHTSSEYRSLLEMLDNFDAYVNRKISKFEDMEKHSIANDINALNSAFLEE